MNPIKALAQFFRSDLTALDLDTKGMRFPTTGYGGSGYDASALWAGSIRLAPDEADYSAIDAVGSDIVSACLGSIAQAFPEARARVTNRGEEVADHPLTRLLARPNRFTTGSELWAATVWEFSRGNCFWWKVRDRLGVDVVELYLLPQRLVRARWPKDGSEWITHYEMWTRSGWVRIEMEDVIHFKNIPFDVSAASDGRYGGDRLAPVLREIYVDREASRWVGSLLRNEAQPGLVLTPKDMTVFSGYSKPDVDAFAAEIHAKFTGDRRGGTMFYPVPLDAEKLAHDPASMSFKEIRRIAEERISALLGVPAIVAGLGCGLDRSTYSNTEEAFRQLWQSCIVPMQRIFAEKLDASLLPDFEPGEQRGDDVLPREGFAVSFDTSQVVSLQESENDAADRDRKALLCGGLMLDEYRQRRGMEPLEDDRGQVFYVPNVATVTHKDAIGEEAEAPEPAAPPAPLQLVAGAGKSAAGFVAGYLKAKFEDATPRQEDYPEALKILEALEVDGLEALLDGGGEER